MKSHFLKSNKGSVSLETALMLVIVFPALYFIMTFFGTAYIYTGKAIETTKGLADYIARWDKWNITNSTINDDNILNNQYDSFLWIGKQKLMYLNHLFLFLNKVMK